MASERMVSLLLERNKGLEIYGKSGYAPIHRAVDSRNLNKVKKLLDNGVDVNSRESNNGITPLQIAAKKGYDSILILLLSRNASVDIKDFFGFAAIHHGVEYGSLNTVKILLDSGADANSRGIIRQTPLHHAARNGYVSIVNLLLARNASVDIKDKSGDTPLSVAVHHKHLKVIELLLNFEANINTKDKHGNTPLIVAAKEHRSDEIIPYYLIWRNACLETTNDYGNGPIHYAVGNNNLNLTKTLLDHGVNVNSRGHKGGTPLHFAIAQGNEEIVNLIISRNASVDLKSEDDITPLYLAVIHSCNLRKVTKTLLDHGANVNVQGTNGETSLMAAANNGDEDAVNLLISRNANLEIKDNICNSAIHFAAMSRNLHVIKALLDHGANVNSKDVNGNTPLNLAISVGREELTKWLLLNVKLNQTEYSIYSKCHSEETELITVIKTLVEHGAEVNSRNLLGQTALHAAAATGDVGIVDYLLSKNACPSIEDNFCYTPFHLAATNSKLNVINTLLTYGDDINRKGCQNVTALHIAIERNDTKLVRYLLTKNADPNVIREDGRTPLSVASQRSFIQLLKLLLDRGAKVEDDSFLRSKVLFDAVANKSLDLVSLLLDRTVNFHTYPTVILNYAIGMQFIEGVRLLISYGANIEQNDTHGNIPLSSAIKSRSTDLVKLILETGTKNIAKENIQTFLDKPSDLKVFSRWKNVTEVHKLSSLHIASYHGFTEGVRQLVSHGASLEGRDERGYTPLHYASENDHFEVVKLLLESGASKSPADINGTTPLHIACRLGLFEIVEALLSDHPVAIDLADDRGYTPLHFATMNGSEEIVQLLLRLEADKNCKNDDLKTPLHLASMEGHTDIVYTLLDAEAENQESDIDGMTPLHFATRERYDDIIGMILHSGAFPDSRNKNGSTALHLACGSYYGKNRYTSPDVGKMKSIINKFFFLGADSRAIDNNRMSPLHIASRDGNLLCVEFILREDKRDIKDKWQYSPIHYAAMNGHVEIVRTFLLKNSEENKRINIKHETPLMLASREGHKDVVALLLQGVVDDFRPDINGRTPLHRSAGRGHFETVKLLLSSMARRDAEDKWGFTALNYAASWRGHQEVMEYLLTPQLSMTLSYYANASNPFQLHLVKMTTFFI